MEYVYVVMQYTDDGGELIGAAGTPDGGKRLAEDAMAPRAWKNDWRGTIMFEGSFCRRTHDSEFYVYREEVHP